MRGGLKDLAMEAETKVRSPGGMIVGFRSRREEIRRDESEGSRRERKVEEEE